MRLVRLRNTAFWRSSAQLGLGAALFFASRGAVAVGLEVFPQGGPRSVGRAGAVLAKPEDPTTITLNPAGLAFLDGNQLFVGFDVPVSHLCVDPHGYYGWGVNGKGTTEFGDQTAVDNPANPTIGATYATTPLDKVCNSAPTAALPQMAWAGKVTDRLALAAGFIAPIVTPGLQFGGADGTVQTAYGPRPTPTRYSLIKQAATDALDPTVAIAYRIFPSLAIGMTGQILMVRAQATAMQNETSGTQPSGDWLATVTTQDFFVPSLTFSAHAKPLSALDLTGAFQWSDDLRGSGDVVYQTATFYQGAATGKDPVPYTNPPQKISTVTVRQPWKLAGGIRVHGSLPGASEHGDPMDTERWDLEADADYTFYKRSGLTTVDVGHTVQVFRKTADGGGSESDANVAALNIDRHLKDVISLRLGGSYALVPRKLAVNAGGFYETRGVDIAYADIDTFAFQRMGFGVGGVLRLGDWDLMAGFSHVYSETVDLAPATGGSSQLVGGSFEGTKRTGGVALPDPTAPSASSATAVAAKEAQPALSTNSPNPVVNSGRYTASFDVISVGMSYHF